MKAFQLKVAIKNSKPPIWRRVIIPAGITFSQLSMILNEVMGWSGYHLFEFEFYYLGIRFIEEADALFEGDYDYIEASSQYIREYLEDEDWFTYTYDLGDVWQHRVTVEKIWEDYPWDYPQVIKFKGDCPIEDCGGIYGYYDCLERINDPVCPDRECLKWMQSQGYPKKYDMEQVNATLKENYFYQWGKGETRTQQEIYTEFLDGKYGLRATQNDINEGEDLFMDDIFSFDGELQKNEAFLQTYDIFQNDTLEDVMQDFSKNQILDMAKDKGLKGVSGYKKDKLIHALSDFMLQPETIENYFLYQTDPAIELFERVISGEAVYETYKQNYLEDIYRAAYIGMLSNGRYIVTSDVAKAYEGIDTEEFHVRRKITSSILCHLRAFILLDGIVPADVVLETIHRDIDDSFSKRELRKFIENIPSEYAEFTWKDGMIYHVMLYPDDRGIQKAQGNHPYYFPTPNEIMDLAIENYLPDNQPLKKIISFLEQIVGVSTEKANMLGKEIQRTISGGCGIEDVFDILGLEGVFVERELQIKRLVSLVEEMWDDTRMLLNKGFTPNEVSRMEKKIFRVSSAEKKSNVISFDEARKNKIYPNDPCPCGSGKKYKNCCKNK